MRVEAGPREAPGRRVVGAGGRVDAGRRGQAGLVFATLGLIGVLLLAVFPVQAYRDQRAQREALVERTAELAAQNQALDARTEQLRTDAEVERLARGYNLVKPGEELYFVLPRPDAPTTTTAPAPAPASPERPRSLWDRITSIF